MLPLAKIRLIASICFLAACDANLQVKTSGGQSALVEEGKIESIASENGPLAKLTMEDCVDPDLSQIPVSVTLTLCNGETAQGLLDLSDLVQQEVAAQIASMTHASSSTGPFADLKPENIRAGVTINGIVGAYPSAAHPLAGATASSDLTALDATTAAGNYEFWDSAGNRHAGVVNDAGAITPGGSNQNFNGIYRSFTVAGDPDLIGANIANGVNIFGVAGAASLETHGNCTGNAQVGCVTTATYQSGDLTNLSSANVKNGVVIAGITGAYPSLASPLAGAGATSDLTSLAATVAAGSYEFWDSTGTRYAGSISDAGSITPSTADQTFNTSLYRTFTVVGDANLTTGNIKSGAAIFGVSGDYPSATHRLAADTATTDLTAFATQLKTNGTFEFFDSTGTRYTGSGDSDIANGNVKSGVAFENISLSGSYLNCSVHADQSSCNADSDCSWKSAACQSKYTWDLRVGQSIGPVTGALKADCRDAISTAFNKDGLPDNTAGNAGTVNDWWDTTDAWQSAAAYPTTLVTGWTANTQCDASNWEDLTPDGTCDSAGDECMYKDKITGTIWSELQPGGPYTWSQVIAGCENLVWGGYSDWRLPTQRELQRAYGDGFSDIAYRGGTSTPTKNNQYFSSTDIYVLSATTISSSTGSVWGMNFRYGFTNNQVKTSAISSLICVRN